MLEKCQMWVETQPSAQSSFQKLNVDNSCQKTCKIWYILEVLSNFTVFLYFVRNMLSRIVVCHAVSLLTDSQTSRFVEVFPRPDSWNPSSWDCRTLLKDVFKAFHFSVCDALHDEVSWCGGNVFGLLFFR